MGRSSNKELDGEQIQFHRDAGLYGRDVGSKINFQRAREAAN